MFVGSETNHPARADFKPPQIYESYDEQRFEDRKWLLGRLDSNRLDRDQQVKDWSELREKTYDAMTRSEGRLAFDLTREPVEVRERYGMHPLGQNLLLARRMVEAGVRFVTVNGWTGQAEHDKAGPPSSSWDMHGGNMGMGNAFGNGSYGMGFCLPRLDQDPPGRQHWPQCFSSIIAGAGIVAGKVYGKSNKYGEHPTHNPVRPEELAATIYHALNIPINNPLDASGISRSLTTGKPIMDLFG